MGVFESERGTGVGSALLAHMLRFAKQHHSRLAVLLSSRVGESMYKQAGFREVCRIAFWYRA